MAVNKEILLEKAPETILDKTPEKNNDNDFRTIKRALNVLMAFDCNNQKLTLTDISKKISLPKPTVLRFLNTFEKEGFLIKNEDGTYMLGYMLYYLGNLAQESIGIKNAAYPVMQKLQSKYNETVSLYLLEDLQRVRYERVESTQALRRYAQLGGKFALWSGACGKAILAFLSEEDFIKATEGIRPLTEKTIADPGKLKKQLLEIRETKIAFSFEETEIGVAAVAAPIFDINHKIIGSVSMSGPSARFDREFAYQVQNSVYEAGKEISLNLGCRNY